MRPFIWKERILFHNTTNGKIKKINCLIILTNFSRILKNNSFSNQTPMKKPYYQNNALSSAPINLNWKNKKDATENIRLSLYLTFVLLNKIG